MCRGCLIIEHLVFRYANIILHDAEIRFSSLTVALKLIFRPLHMKNNFRNCLEIIVCIARIIITLAFGSGYKHHTL